MAGARRDGGEDDVELRDPAVGDPRLLAVEHVAAVDLAGAGAHRGGVRAGVGLGRGERGHRRALAGQRAQPALLLLLRPERQHGLGEEPVGGDQVADPGQPWQSSSCTRQPVSASVIPPPPSYSGSMKTVSPIPAALCHVSIGTPSRPRRPPRPPGGSPAPRSRGRRAGSPPAPRQLEHGGTLSLPDCVVRNHLR